MKTPFLSRRSFVSACAIGAPVAALATLPRLARASAPAPRALRFDHLHTGERLNVEYFSAGAYVPDALVAVDHLLRDFRTEAVGQIDPGLLDLLYRLTVVTGTGKPFEIISGYRSPATNAMLHERSSGVATRSANECHVHPREVFQIALLQGAVSFLVAHNHPSGDTTPSSHDVAMTKHLKEAGDLLAIKLLDHVIVTDASFHSFSESGAL